MMERGVGALVITRDGEPVGIFTDRDAVKAYATGIGPEEEVKKVATMNVITVDEDTEPYAAVQLMSTKKFRHLPVKDKNGNIIGMFSLSDIAKYLGDY